MLIAPRIERSARQAHRPHDPPLALDIVERDAINRSLAVHGETLPDADVPLHDRRPAA